MKKKFLTIVCLMFLLSMGSVLAKTTSNAQVSDIIRLYKAGNYAECYTKLTPMLEKDPSNALLYYYMAITSVQIGKKEEAIENYSKAISLASPNSNLQVYAIRGKVCIQEPDMCHSESNENILNEFVKSRDRGYEFTQKVLKDYETLKLENMMREMNRNNDIPAKDFREYRDFSSMNTDLTPTNDEIVEALKTLQRAGFSSNPYGSDISLFAGLNNSMDNSRMSNQLIQTMLTNNMTLGF